MQGSVRKKGATWSYRVEFGVVDGKRNQIERSGFRTKSDATKAMNVIIFLILGILLFCDTMKENRASHSSCFSMTTPRAECAARASHSDLHFFVTSLR